MGYDYKIAMETLSEVEKNRIVCAYLNCPTSITSSVDWQKATADFGSASIDSMKKGIANSLKKIENAGGKIAGDGSPVKATPKSGGGKKRTKVVATADGDADDVEETPTKKKRGRKPKTAKAGDAGANEESNIKEEGEGDLI